MIKNKKLFIKTMPIILSMCSLFTIYNSADAARAAVRSTSVARKATSETTQQTATTKTENTTDTIKTTTTETVAEKPIIINKSSQFDDAVSNVLESSGSDNSFAEAIRRQRDALAASEAATTLKESQQKASKSGRNACDTGLRDCMTKICGNDFTKCALDGDTIFGDKLNKCKRETECTGEEFNLFTTEIRADRDMNVKLLSYNNVINCGNSYNACIINECGTTYDKCLGKSAADTAIQKCSALAKQCAEADSGLTSRFGTAIGKLRENAEIAVKSSEAEMYDIRDKIKNQCTALGATFDERTMDCVYTVKFFAGEDGTLMASRKRYAGYTFTCSPEWFGVNVTTFKENAYRETSAQKAASMAMMGSGLGTATGLITSDAIGRAQETQKAKKALKAAEKEEKEKCENTDGMKWKDGKCVEDTKKSKDKEENKTSLKEKASNLADKAKGATSKLKDKFKKDDKETKPAEDAGDLLVTPGKPNDIKNLEAKIKQQQEKPKTQQEKQKTQEESKKTGVSATSHLNGTQAGDILNRINSGNSTTPPPLDNNKNLSTQKQDAEKENKKANTSTENTFSGAPVEEEVDEPEVDKLVAQYRQEQKSKKSNTFSGAPVEEEVDEPEVDKLVAQYRQEQERKMFGTTGTTPKLDVPDRTKEKQAAGQELQQHINNAAKSEKDAIRAQKANEKAQAKQQKKDEKQAMKDAKAYVKNKKNNTTNNESNKTDTADVDTNHINVSTLIAQYSYGYGFDGKCIGQIRDDCGGITELNKGKGSWSVHFYNEKKFLLIYGDASCQKSGKNSSICSCRTTDIDDLSNDSGPENSSGNSLDQWNLNGPWLEIKNEKQYEKCQENCAQDCADYVANDKTVRQKLLGPFLDK